jgi:hypothetical protein
MKVLEKISKCTGIHANMVLFAAIFVNPPVAMAVFKDAIDALQAAQSAMSQGGQDRKAIRDAALAVIDPIIEELKNYVNDLAKGDMIILTRSAFPLNKERVPSGLTPKMVILSVVPGPVAGSLTVDCAAIKGVKQYYLSYAIADENGFPTQWSQELLYSRKKMELGGLPPRTLVWIRTRALAGQSLGAWSDPAPGSTI